MQIISTFQTMIIPYADINPTRKTPYVTYGLIIVNVLVFLITFSWLTLPPEEQVAVLRQNGGLVPAQLEALDFLSSMFLHGGIMHLAGNMLFLWITGDNIEGRFGSVWYIFFYVLCGVAAAGAQIAVAPGSNTPMIGASGAISGVMGAYLVLFPHSRIKIFYWIYFFIGRTTIAAIWWIGLWIGFQLLYGSLSGGSGGGVAYMAHIGGFAMGAAIAGLARYLNWVEAGVKLQQESQVKDSQAPLRR